MTSTTVCATSASSGWSGPSKYRVTEYAHGFRIEGPDRPPVQVWCRPTLLDVDVPSFPGGPSQRFGLFEFYKLNAAVAEGLMREWQPPRRDRRLWSHCRHWAVTQTQRAINSRVHEQWHRLLGTLDPTVVAVHRAIFAATLGAAEVAMDRELYRHPYLVRDIIRYRAAAVAARYVAGLGERAREKRVVTSPQAVGLRTFAAELGVDVEIRAGQDAGFSGLVSHDETTDSDRLGRFVDDLQDWRGLFSPTGKSYRSLNRTLMRLPGGVPPGLVCLLNELRLGHPLLHRAELILATLFAADPRPGRKRKIGAFARARVLQIREALRRVAAHTRNDLIFRRTRDLRFLVTFLLDYPDDHRGSLVGLAHKAIRWHQHELVRERRRILKQYGAATRLAPPPVIPPADANIRFLATVEDVTAEGEALEHCIASYIPGAVEGGCYLFHVDYRGESASLMVDRRGLVVQAGGPRNRRNRASVWGTRTLAAWGRAWPPLVGSAAVHAGDDQGRDECRP